jgi:uncharacterized membrane protein
MKKRKNGKTPLMMNNLIFAWASIAVAGLLTMMVGSAIYAFCIGGDGRAITEVKGVNGAVLIPGDRFADGTARFYGFNNGTKEIVFFVVRGSDGTLHTAFDACEVCCFRKRTGYIQKRDYMVCLGCRERYAINMIDQVNGIGCRPQRLPHSEEGGNIVITEADLKRGARYFP